MKEEIHREIFQSSYNHKIPCPIIKPVPEVIDPILRKILKPTTHHKIKKMYEDCMRNQDKNSIAKR